MPLEQNAIPQSSLTQSLTLFSGGEGVAEPLSHAGELLRGDVTARHFADGGHGHSVRHCRHCCRLVLPHHELQVLHDVHPCRHRNTNSVI